MRLFQQKNSGNEKIYLFALCCTLPVYSYTMEPADDEVAKPRGLLRCCSSTRVASSNKQSVKNSSVKRIESTEVVQEENVRAQPQDAVSYLVALYLKENDGFTCPGCTPGPFLDRTLAMRHIISRKEAKQIKEATQCAIATAGLFFAIHNKNLQCMLQHIAQGADVNAKDGIGWAPIHYAIRDRNAEAATVLFAVKELDLQSCTANGLSLLQLIHTKREYATVGQQTRCDIMLQSLTMVSEGTYPYRVKDHQLIELATGKSVLSTLSELTAEKA